MLTSSVVSCISSHLSITRSEVALDQASAYWLDVEAFEHRIGSASALRESPVSRESAAALAEAIELYRDDFLVGLTVHRAPAFEGWMLLEREHLRILALRALHALVDYHGAGAQPARTLAYLDRLLALEPAHEEAHRHKMLLLARQGQRAASLRQYEACRQAVQALDAELDEETTALYQRIRAGTDLPVPLRVPRHNLPSPLTPLVGRAAELAQIRACLRDPACRLLTLVGPGGSGKTHLALQAAADMLRGDALSAGSPDCFEHGVYVVRLGSHPAVEAIAPAIVQALDLPLSEGAHPLSRRSWTICGGSNCCWCWTVSSTCLRAPAW